jgi:hydrogenase small subunit
MAPLETLYDTFRQKGVSRWSFLELCSITAAAMGLGPVFAPRIAPAMETRGMS